VAQARLAERLGYDFLTASDHPAGNHPTFETWTLLTWVAANTERIGLMPNVLGLPYRKPVMLAKMTESLDRFSGGRLTLGLGAGGGDEERMRALGLEVLTPAERVQALGEEIEILRRLWAETDVTYDGERFRIEGVTLTPRAHRAIPIWVGAYGPRAVALTGRLADGWTPSLPYLPPSRAVTLRALLLEAAEEAGRDSADITCNYNVGVMVGGHAHDERVVAGSAEGVCEQLLGFVRIGFTSLTIWPIGDEEAQMTRFAEEVMGPLREAAADL